MIPDCDLQLRVVIKALKDVVSPAVDPENRLAVEQIKLSLATLEMVQTRAPLVDRRVRKELSHAIDLASAIHGSESADDRIEPLIDEAGEALKQPNADSDNLERIRTSLLSAISQAIDAADPSDLQRISRMVVANSKSQIELQRAWCLPSGFEPNSSAIRSLGDILNR